MTDFQYFFFSPQNIVLTHKYRELSRSKDDIPSSNDLTISILPRRHKQPPGSK